ncbi:hypothetical protein PMAYCL1PPCAC_05039 [Pristionchus mayeri]|uniref:Uncharacterized protein n=1 Tax=Pristionchus mayeri TaxID=1317129 RepID=A0AAN4Z816_9BILA|nr:hypothetical protein PMAYCL1PPCAC_05039 [Pristionchus mayeri]
MRRCDICDEPVPQNYLLTPFGKAERADFLRNVTTRSKFERDRLATLKGSEEQGILCAEHDLRSRQCYLCDRYTREFRMTPKNAMQRSEFLSKIIAQTTVCRDRVRALAMGTQTAFFCLRHVVQTQRPTIVANVQKKQHGTLRCSLCGSKTTPFCFMPKDKAHARKFCAALTGLDETQREIVDWFLVNDKRMTVCRKHITTFAKFAESQPVGSPAGGLGLMGRTAGKKKVMKCVLFSA